MRRPLVRAYLVWGVGVLAYVVAVFQRTSLGVAGPETIDRFAASPALLSGLVVMQVSIYAAMQIPAGLLLDRYGTRILVTTGCIVMAIGQTVLAVTLSLPLAVVGRFLVGLGDSLTLIAVLRLVAQWFPSRRAALLSQMTGMIGQLGQVISAVPFALILRIDGWTTAFSAAAALSVFTAVLVASAVADAPGNASDRRDWDRERVSVALRATWRNLGTRLGFFVHMGTMFSLTSFVLLWGVPYLIRAQGISPLTVSAMLTASVGASIFGGVLLGIISARKPAWRCAAALVIIAANMVTWASVLLKDGPSSSRHLLILVLVMSLGAPGSLIGFDLARTTNPPERLGTAQGVVNTGGYLATLIVVLGVGYVLSVQGSYDLDAFRSAWAVQYIIWFTAVTGILLFRPRRTVK